MQNEERQKIELRKQQQYSADVFERKQKEDFTQIQTENLQLIKYKENIFKKILNKIIKFFTKK